MIKSTYIFFVFFMLTAVWSCNRPSDMQREHPAVSPTFYADSLRTLGRGIRLIKEEKESLAFPPLDSVFRWTKCSLPKNCAVYLPNLSAG